MLSRLVIVGVRIEIDVNNRHLCIVVLLGSLWQRVKVDVDGRGLGAALGSASLYENVGVLLLRVRWWHVCILRNSVCEGWVVYAIVWV